MQVRTVYSVAEAERQRLISASLRVADELERQARMQREAAARLMRPTLPKEAVSHG